MTSRLENEYQVAKPKPIRDISALVDLQPWEFPEPEYGICSVLVEDLVYSVISDGEEKIFDLARVSHVEESLLQVFGGCNVSTDDAESFCHLFLLPEYLISVDHILEVGVNAFFYICHQLVSILLRLHILNILDLLHCLLFHCHLLILIPNRIIRIVKLVGKLCLLLNRDILFKIINELSHLNILIH